MIEPIDFMGGGGEGGSVHRNRFIACNAMCCPCTLRDEPKRRLRTRLGDLGLVKIPETE